MKNALANIGRRSHQCNLILREPCNVRDRFVAIDVVDRAPKECIDGGIAL